jgi:nucleoid DNA-binding protein
MVAKKRKTAKRKAKRTTKKAKARKVVKKAKKTRKTKKTRKAAPKKRKTKKAKKKATAAPKKVTAMPTIRKALTKSEICKILAGHAGITKKQAKDLLDALPKVIKAHLAAGVDFKLDFVKITKVHKKAKKARKGINPFTGEEMMFKAKPAHYVVKVRALKKLKEMVKRK